MRDQQSLNSFFEGIAEIEPTEDIQRKWKKVCRKCKLDHAPLTTISEIEQLYYSVYDPNFKQYETYLDIPSNSQWLGHYARSAGIQAIIYLSLRNESGFNIAVFPNNLKETDSFIELADSAPYIDVSRTKMDSDNCEFFKCTLEDLKTQLSLSNH